MGQQLPQIANRPVNPQRREQFESKYVQRVKEVPFIDAELYSSDPLLFVDPLGPRLSHLLQPRIGTKQLFPAEEVEKLAFSGLSGLADLEEQGLEGHGDVGLETLYYSVREKYFRLAHPIFNLESGYLLAKHGKRFTPLAPQQLSALSEDSEGSEVSIKADVFALGIVLCQVCTLTRSSDIYCPDTYSIFHLEIQKRLKTIEEYYSPQFSQIVQECLQYDPDERPSPAALLQKLTEGAKSSRK